MEFAWEKKAHRIISIVCKQSYKQTNTRKNGKKYKKHRPYHVPQLAKDLIKCLEDQDEERAKALFLSYEGMKAIKNDS